jgi:hypothetical protein
VRSWPAHLGALRAEPLKVESAMSSHAFDVLSRSATQIEVVHKAEGHRYRFPIVRNAQGKRSLGETVEVSANPDAAHRPELFSGSARAFAISEAHRKQAID